MSGLLSLEEFRRVRDENAMREIEARGIEYRHKAEALWEQIRQLEKSKVFAADSYELKQIDEDVKALAWQWQQYDAPLPHMRAHWQAAKDRLEGKVSTPRQPSVIPLFEQVEEIDHANG